MMVLKTSSINREFSTGGSEYFFNSSRITTGSEDFFNSSRIQCWWFRKLLQFIENSELEVLKTSS